MMLFVIVQQPVAQFALSPNPSPQMGEGLKEGDFA
jgi:hypothetical protein